MTAQIVSKTSARKDTVVLPELYYAAGVRESWLIDARGQETDFILFQRL